MPVWISKFFSVKMAALIIGLWFISEAQSWQTQIIMGVVVCVFVTTKAVQNCVETWRTKEREEEVK